jgi:hypothetical protein
MVFFRLKEFYLAVVFVQIGLLQFAVYCLTIAEKVTPGHFVIFLSSCVLQQLSIVTLHFPVFLPEFSSSLQCHDIQQVAVSLTWGANPKFVVTSHLPLQFE